MKKQLNIILLMIVALCRYSYATPVKDSIIYAPASSLYIAGKPFNTTHPYQRVDTAKYPKMPASVKNLLTHSAGLVVCFTSNSTSIYARWCLRSTAGYGNIAPINSHGLNLYVQKNGNWQFAGVGKPDGKTQCTQTQIVANLDEGEKKFLLYLPTYSAVTSLEIGIPQGSTLKPLTNVFKKRVIVYGSSITQGASASRSGLAYPAILSRHLGYDFVNVGMSGSAKMEPEVVAMINDIEGDAYLLDCIPNSSVQEIKDRTRNMVMAIKKAHPGKPIILLNSIDRELGFADSKIGESVLAQNRAVDSIAHILLKNHTSDFYFIDTHGFLGTDHEASIDYVHPNDLGFYRFVQNLEPILTGILKKYF